MDKQNHNNYNVFISYVFISNNEKLTGWINFYISDKSTKLYSSSGKLSIVDLFH